MVNYHAFLNDPFFICFLFVSTVDEHSEVIRDPHNFCITESNKVKQVDNAANFL